MGMPCLVVPLSSRPVTELSLCEIHLTLLSLWPEKGPRVFQSLALLDWTWLDSIFFDLLKSQLISNLIMENIPSYLQFSPILKGRELNKVCVPKGRNLGGGKYILGFYLPLLLSYCIFSNKNFMEGTCIQLIFL